MKKIYNFIKFINRKTGGSTLAELAVVTAIMATLTATASAKLSTHNRDSKIKKTNNEFDKMKKMAQGFYQMTADTEGRGRFPGQEKFTMPVGGYGKENEPSESYEEHWENYIAGITAIHDALPTFDDYTEQEAANWVSIWDTDQSWYPSSAQVSNDTYTACHDCSNSDLSWGKTGGEEWLTLFNWETLNSKFQDGHYIYVVVPGGGTGDDTFPPTMYLADLANPYMLHTSITP